MYAQNQLLRDVTDRLAQVQPTEETWENIIAYLRQDRRFTSITDLQYRASMLAEGYVQWHILQESIRFPERIQMSPIPDGARTKRFQFRYDGGELKVMSRGHQGVPCLQVTGYDLVALFDGIPVMFEVKISKRYRGRGRLRKDGGNNKSAPGSTLGVAGLMTSRERIEERLSPIRDYFQTADCGYAIVIALNQVKDDLLEQQEFRQDGGIIVPFYTDGRTFRNQDAQGIIENYLREKQ